MKNNAGSLTLSDCISASWDRVHGSKGTFWAAVGIVFLITFFIGMVSGVLSSFSSLLGGIVNFIGQIVSFLLQIGFLYIAIQRAKDLPINFKQIFFAFDKRIALNIIAIYILEVLIFLALGFVIGILPMLIWGANTFNLFQSGFSAANFILVAWLVLGIFAVLYVSLRLYVSMAFVLDKGMGPIEAIKASLAVTKHHIWTLLGILVVQILAFVVGILLLGVGLIWTLPLGFIMYGVTYKKLTGSR